MVNNVGKGPDLSLPRRMTQPIVSISRGTVRTQAFTCRNVTLPLIDFYLGYFVGCRKFSFPCVCGSIEFLRSSGAALSQPANINFLIAGGRNDLSDPHRLCSPGPAAGQGSCQGSGPSGCWWQSRQTPAILPPRPKSLASPAGTGPTPWTRRAGIIRTITMDRSKPVLTQVTETPSRVMEWREGVRGV